MAYQSFVDHTYSALPKIKYGPVEGMGDFATQVGTNAGKYGPEISNMRRFGRGLKALGPRGIARTATGPLGTAITVLAPVAQATANRAVESGQQSEPSITKAPLNSMPSRAIDTRGISNTNPFTGQVQTNYKNTPALVTKQIQAVKTPVAPWIANPFDWTQEAPNSLPAVPPPSTKTTPEVDPHGFAMVGGKKINYADIGDNRVSVVPSNENSTQINQGGTDLNNILQTIQAIQPVQDYASRINALNHGNTTWDMNSLDKILAAKAGQQADQERYQQQTSALANLGTAQMNADAARYGHEIQAQSDAAKNAYLAPYYKSEAEKNTAEAKNAPLTAIAPLIKDKDKLKLTDKDRLEQAVKVLELFGVNIPTDPSDPGFEAYHQAKDTFDYLTSKRK